MFLQVWTMDILLYILNTKNVRIAVKEYDVKQRLRQFVFIKMIL